MKGEWGKIKSQRIPMNAVSTLRDPADQKILAMLAGARDGYWPGYDYNYASYSMSNRFALSTTLQQLCIAADVRDGALRVAFVEEECRAASHRVGRRRGLAVLARFAT